ncbi:MAG: hypothetical protein LUM44_12345 [Pyrinomonadaceae bacterium]|nr:hypothetical protein [Pyrinomonadaceae bacterium]
MQNKIDATLSAADRDRILELIDQIRDILPFLVDLSIEDRQSLVKMGDSGRPFVEEALNLVEQEDSFMPRSFDKTQMRQDNDFYEMMIPVLVQLTQLYEAVNDTMMLTGSDLIMAGLDVYRNAKNNGRGANLDNLVPLLGKRFKSNRKKDDGTGSNSPPT